jgi:hypothetical protein
LLLLLLPPPLLHFEAMIPHNWKTRAWLLLLLCWLLLWLQNLQLSPWQP